VHHCIALLQAKVQDTNGSSIISSFGNFGRMLILLNIEKYISMYITPRQENRLNSKFGYAVHCTTVYAGPFPLYNSTYKLEFI
jgi:hypothetical protein